MVAMRKYRTKVGAALGAACALSLVPILGLAQERAVVSSEIAVSGGEAALRLDFLGPDSEPLRISFRDGHIFLNGQSVGDFVRGDLLDTSWRSLLGQAVSLDDGPLAEALMDWEPPDDLTGDAREMGQLLNETLEGTLSEPLPSRPQQELELPALASEGALMSLLRLGQAEHLGALAEAFKDLSFGNVRIVVGEDLTIDEGEEVAVTLVVVDGDLDVWGEVDGDVVLTGGTLRLREGSRIDGEVRLADADVIRSGGVVTGDIEKIQAGVLDEEELADLRDEIRDELQLDAHDVARAAARTGSGTFHRIGSGIGGVFQNFLTFLILAVLGVVIVQFSPSRLNVVADAARKNSWKAGLVGVAGGFLLLPVWILGVVILAVSIIGIPVLIAWVPFFPVVAALAGLLGFVAVARNLGEWVADQKFRGLEWVRGSNSFYTMVAGLGALMVPFVVANILGAVLPWFGILSGLMNTVGVFAMWLVLAIGFGAVLLTRGGKRPYYSPEKSPFDPDESAWPDDPNLPEDE
jgi:hypothetical protein